jgi:hypothetical protein
MRYRFLLAAVLSVGVASAALAQDADSVEISPGFKLASNGLVNIGDISAEVYHFNGDWTIAEQHDVFEPSSAAAAPTTQPDSHVVTGTFTSEAGPFKLTERLDGGDGVKFSAAISAEKELATNDLSVSFQLPADSFSGKQIVIDQQPFTLPAAPAKAGSPHLLEKDGVHEIDLPTANGTLVITGNLSVLVQDDREFGDQRYALRLHFSPSTGKIKESRIEFGMKLNPAKD